MLRTKTTYSKTPKKILHVMTIKPEAAWCWIRKAGLLLRCSFAETLVAKQLHFQSYNPEIKGTESRDIELIQ